MKKGLKIVFIVLILGLVGVYGVIYATRPINVNCFKAEPSTFVQSFKEEGKVTCEVDRPVYSLMSGQITNVYVKEGQKVNRGDVLARINVSELNFQLDELKARLKSIEGQEKKAHHKPYEEQEKEIKLKIESTQEQLKTLRTSFARTKALYEKGAIPKQQYEQMQDSLNKMENLLLQQKNAFELLERKNTPIEGTDEYLEGQKQSIKAQIELLKYKKLKSNITAPVSGTVRKCVAKEDMVITQGTKLMNIFNPSSYEVETFVLTKDMPLIEKDMKVNLILETKNKDISFEGEIEKIAPSAQEKVSTLGLVEQRVKVTINPDLTKQINIKPGYVLDVEFVTNKVNNGLSIPKTAVFSYNGDDAVWTVQDGKAIIQKIVKGIENDRRVIVKEGIKKGALIILNTDLKGLKEGKEVKVNLVE